jgi:hypothetical protein
MSTEMRELTADEIDEVNGGLVISVNLGFVKAYVTVTPHGVSGGVKVGDGKWQGGSIFYDDLPKPA